MAVFLVTAGARPKFPGNYLDPLGVDFGHYYATRVDWSIGLLLPNLVFLFQGWSTPATSFASTRLK